MKKLVSVLLSLTLAAGLLSGCGSDSASGKTTIKVAASSTPHAEILENCKEAMAAEGYTLEVQVMDDYITPNNATESGDVDANYFQHQPYLDDFNKENNTHLVSVAKIHYEPFGIYAGTAKALADLKDGDKIAVPNDPTNEARALMLLDAQGLIKLDNNSNLTATKKNITENPHNYNIVEMEAALITKSLDEVGVAVINGNYAINAGLKVANALATESAASTAAQTYANVLVVKEGNENSDAVRALVKVLTSQATKDFIAEKYAGAVVAIF